MPDADRVPDYGGLMPGVLDAVAPPRLGSGFRWLVGSSWVTNLGDGVALAAGPLLIEAETGSASLVGLSWLALRLPWLLFGLYAGVIADRFDRRRVLMVANGARALVLGVLTAVIAADQVSVPVIFVSLFAIGISETFADTTSSTLLPMVVEKEDLTLGNSRLVFGHTGLNQLIGPPIGAAMFAAGMWIPFGAQALVSLLGAAMVQKIVFQTLRPNSGSSLSQTGGTSRTEIKEGIKWVASNPPIRTLALTIFFFNITFGGSFALLVSLAKERLGLEDFGFGLLITMSAIGGVVGSVLYRRAEQAVGIVVIMKVGLLIEALTHLVLAVTTTAALAFAIMVLFGVHEAMWGTTSSSIRQALVPDELQGRVASVYMILLMGGLVIGAGLGSLLAAIFGITGPYWFGSIGTALVLGLIWRRLDSIVHAAA